MLGEENTGYSLRDLTRLDQEWTELGNLEVFRDKEIICSFEVRSFNCKASLCFCKTSDKLGSDKANLLFNPHQPDFSKSEGSMTSHGWAFIGLCRVLQKDLSWSK